MVWIGNLLVTLITQALAFFGINLAKKTVFALAALSAMLALTAAFVVASKALLMGAIAVLPAWAHTGAAMIVPPNLSAVIGAYFGARVGRWIYDYHMAGLKIVSYIT